MISIFTNLIKLKQSMSYEIIEEFHQTLVYSKNKEERLTVF